MSALLHLAQAATDVASTDSPFSDIASLLSSVGGIALCTAFAVGGVKMYVSGTKLGDVPTWMYVIAISMLLTAVAVVMRWLPFEASEWRDWVNLFIRSANAALIAAGGREVFTSLKSTPNNTKSKITGTVQNTAKLLLLGLLVFTSVGCTPPKATYENDTAHVATLVSNEMTLATNTMRFVRVLYVAGEISDDELPAIKQQAKLWVDTLNEADDLIEAGDLDGARKKLDLADRALEHFKLLPGTDQALISALEELNQALENTEPTSQREVPGPRLLDEVEVTLTAAKQSLAGNSLVCRCPRSKRAA